MNESIHPFVFSSSCCLILVEILKWTFLIIRDQRGSTQIQRYIESFKNDRKMVKRERKCCRSSVTQRGFLSGLPFKWELLSTNFTTKVVYKSCCQRYCLSYLCCRQIYCLMTLSEKLLLVSEVCP